MGVQAKMTFANNILVVGVVLALAVRSSWEQPLGDKVFDVELVGSIEIIPNTTTTATTLVTTPTTTASVTTPTTTAANVTTPTTTAANVTATTTAANVSTPTTTEAVTTP